MNYLNDLKMKKSSLLFLALVFLFGACDNEKLNNEADIIISFKVKGTSGLMFNTVISDNNDVTVKVSPYVDVATELDGALPIFYLSKGATVTPDPAEPQNFTQIGGVKYTVTAENGKTQKVYTVSWDISDQLPYGEGFSYAEIGTFKRFYEMGYPGPSGTTSDPLFGDMQMYIAYCGDYIVMLSRQYINQDSSSPYCVWVVNKTTLVPAGTFNRGSISLPNLRMITSDYKGRCVAAVVTGNETEIFYWTTPSDAPRSIGKIGVNMAESTDGSANFNVAGDITGDAWITAMATRSSAGNHYRVKVTNGQLASTHSIVSTGYSSSDCNGFQMISSLDDSEKPSYVIGDGEGTAGSNNTIKVYIMSRAGATVQVIPSYWQNILQAWWVGTGATTQRVGGKTPVVSALPVNGKTYVAVTSGTGWWTAAAVLSSDLQSLAHGNLNIAIELGTSRGWSFGESLDWYWSDDNNEAYLAVWAGRYGLRTFKLTCFE